MTLKSSHWKLSKSASGFSASFMILICILFVFCVFFKERLVEQYHLEV